MEAPGLVCSACNSNAAVCFCMCTEAEVLFCSSCFSLHSQENATCQHPTFPVEDLPQVKQPGPMERLQVRKDNLPEVQDMALKSLGEVDKCIAELRAKIEELNNFYGKTVERLTEKKREIEESMKEVEATVLQEQPEFNTPFGRPIRDCLEGKSTWLEPFRYKINDFDPSRLLNISEPTPLLEISKIPCIAWNSLRIYDIKLKQFTSFNLSISFTVGTACCLLDDEHVLCLGGSPASNLTYMVESTTQKVSAMRNLNTPRCYAGVIKVSSNVYAFGSKDPDSATCEKFPLLDQVWTNLKDMDRTRRCFQPASHLDDIYLADHQRNYRSIEVFNTTSETFRNLHFWVPSDLASCITAFVISGELFLASLHQIGRWKINSTEEMETSPHPAWTYDYSNYPAFVIGNEVYFVTKNPDLFKYNVETKSGTTISPPPPPRTSACRA